LREDAKKSEKDISYDIKIYDELGWRKRKFEFHRSYWDPNHMSLAMRTKLCLGQEDREYTVIGEAFPFPDREDSPVVNVPNEPCTLLWDHNSPTEKIMIQLSPYFPPILWLTVKPNIAALRKIFREFMECDTEHMKRYLPYYESVQNKIESQQKEKLGEGLSQSALKDQFVEDMRQKDPQNLELDWQHNHSMFCGVIEHFRLVEDKYMKKNPFVFGWPLLLGENNHHLAEKPLRVAAFRTLFSKSIIMLHTRLDLQLDHRQCKLTEDDETDIFLDLPLFVTVNFPENSRLCGGKALIERFNKVMGTSFPDETPVDVIAALLMENQLKGVPQLVEELEFLKKASEKVPDVERVIRLSQDMIGTSRILGQLAYTIVYLAIMDQPDWIENVFDRFRRHDSEMIRVACAKGAHILCRDDLVFQMIDDEPIGRCRELIKLSVSMPAAKYGTKHSQPQPDVVGSGNPTPNSEGNQ
jgi:hypothetical protein